MEGNLARHAKEVSNSGSLARAYEVHEVRDIDGKDFFIRLRKAYTGSEPLGVRISKRVDGASLSVEQYDLKGILKGSQLTHARDGLLDAFNLLINSSTFSAGLSLLKEMEKADLCDVCRFRTVGK